jgi:MinD-like ATPase involved in chromosome partitioning or flagellar assembly
VIGFIPSDYQTAVTSINLGEPLVKCQANSKIALEIRRIAASLSGVVAPVEEDTSKNKRSLWSSVFKKESSQAQAQLKLQASMKQF